MTISLGSFFKQLIMTFSLLPPIRGGVLEAQQWQEKDTAPASRRTLLLCRCAALTTALVGGIELTLSFSEIQDTALRLVVAFSGIAFIFMSAYISAITILAKKPRTIIVKNKHITTRFKIALFLYSSAFLFVVMEANINYAIALTCAGLIPLYLYQKKANKNV
ncbi:TPA: hypothetical protein ACKQKD_000505 [Pseudomonas aeruginosa]